ncbi:MAG: 4Fe-4S binding protein [Caldimicrobium sp.]|nr:4Fe-4S binding protein [Caldimicrobium sp.]MCX7612700.1 4Fe-4S binding protein [Caldimicrobium sp.]MDW8182440.1 4Fe-4S binding protein [Caldimicrobium sp.]
MSKVLRKIIEIDEELCNGCGECLLACQEGALAIVDGKAKLVGEFLCDGLGACLGVCPTGALRLVEREADEFDEHAVEEHLKRLKAYEEAPKESASLPCGCPSSQLREFSLEMNSALTHWPVQIRLIPVSAPFLKDAKVLVCADCVPVAYPRLHSELLPDRKIMIGCPKFDPLDIYVDKFKEIFKRVPLKSVEVAIMEVPCCKGLVHILKEARKLADRELPIKVYIIGVKGEVLRVEEC